MFGHSLGMLSSHRAIALCPQGITTVPRRCGYHVDNKCERKAAHTEDWRGLAHLGGSCDRSSHVEDSANLGDMELGLRVTAAQP